MLGFVAQPVDGAAVLLGRAAFPFERDGGRDPQLLRQTLPQTLALGILVEEQRRIACRTAALREGGYDHPVLERPDPDLHPVAHVHGLGALGVISVDFDFPAVDRRGRERARLEEPRGPQPTVETDRLVVRRQTSDLS